MIPKGSQRGGGEKLGLHLVRTFTPHNEAGLGLKANSNVNFPPSHDLKWDTLRPEGPKTGAWRTR
jgi:hypothetical protein